MKFTSVVTAMFALTSRMTQLLQWEQDLDRLIDRIRLARSQKKPLSLAYLAHTRTHTHTHGYSLTHSLTHTSCLSLCFSILAPDPCYYDSVEGDDILPPLVIVEGIAVQ